MYYCFHPCCQFLKPRPAADNVLWGCRNWGWVFGLRPRGLALCMANTDPIFWSALQHSIQLDNKYQMIRQHGGNGTEVRVLITSYFVLFEKLVWMRDQHVHTSCHTLLTRPSLSVRRLHSGGRRRQLPYHKRPWDIHLKFSIILFIRGWVSQSCGSQSNFSL